MPTARLLALALGALGLVASPANARAPTLHGTYANTCAPYDGAAFVVMLEPAGPMLALGEQLRLMANVALAQAVGTWPHSDLSAPGHAEIIACQTRPQPTCTFPRAGSFRVDRAAKGVMTGSFEAVFKDGRQLRGSFSAVDRSQRMMCG